MDYTIYDILFLFFLYSFAGWILETLVSSAIGRHFRNRGFVASPFCFMYGMIWIAVTILFKELRGSVVLLFMGATLVSALIQWLTGLALEAMGQGKWWDYSALPLNFNGFIAAPVSCAFGGAGTLLVLFGNDVLIGLFRLIPFQTEKVLSLILLGTALLDLLLSLAGLAGATRKNRQVKKLNRAMENVSSRMEAGLASRVERRLAKAYPEAAEQEDEGKEEGKLRVIEIFWVFVIGAFAGDVVETFFMRYKKGIWMSRSSLVWGMFSVVWGIAMALASAMLHRDRKRSDGYIFLIGTLLGGTYEYICSVFTELAFGVVFWSYRKLPYNIAGRINLLYCFFWGIAAVLWIKKIFPPIHRALKRFLAGPGRYITPFLAIFMAANIVFSILALKRYDERAHDKPPSNQVEVYFDTNYDDEEMKRIYPNAIRRN